MTYVDPIQRLDEAVAKHGGSSHSQSDHGNWAHGSVSSKDGKMSFGSGFPKSIGEARAKLRARKEAEKDKLKRAQERTSDKPADKKEAPKKEAPAAKKDEPKKAPPKEAPKPAPKSGEIPDDHPAVKGKRRANVSDETWAKLKRGLVNDYNWNQKKAERQAKRDADEYDRYSLKNPSVRGLAESKVRETWRDNGRSDWEYREVSEDDMRQEIEWWREADQRNGR